MDITSLKCSNMLKSRHTIKTIPKQMNLMNLSLPPVKKSRSESPSNISETTTQKNVYQNQLGIVRNGLRRPSQKFLQIQGGSKYPYKKQITKVNNNLAVVIEKEQQIVLKQNQQTQQINKQNNENQLSMDPQSLQFRNMIIQQTKNEDKTLIERIFMMKHRLLDLKEILKLEASLDINYQNDEGNTILMSASKCRATQIVDYLLRNGADVNIQNYFGQTAMDLALLNYQFVSADIIFKYLKPENRSF
ncbi:unnamed protein product [Paramecium sonneborni]|uniref:Ankyrin repeat protein n=1 Tax=Paramecium sonneborni TaxID=65129 RepID=A0A8S1RMZ9_9CILI|nr:unnamed protein product [Paramecium sonneborni]